MPEAPAWPPPFVCAAALTACAAAPAVTPTATVDADGWAAVVEAARGQTLDWYMYNGDEAVNAVVEGYVAPRLSAEYGVTLQVVPVADTADAVNKVLAERQAGRAGSGTVDAIWINGENFATGKQAGLWLCDYPGRCPTLAMSNLTAGGDDRLRRAGRRLRGGVAAGDIRAGVQLGQRSPRRT